MKKNKIAFQLYDETMQECISCHSSIKSVLNALRDMIDKETNGVCNAFKDDPSVSITFRYTIESFEIKE